MKILGGINKMYSVAIDGPSGAGKSTIARAAAKVLGFIYVDTGALYRAIGYYIVKQGINTKDEHAVSQQLKNIDISLKYDNNGKQQVILNNNDVSEYIRTPEVSMAASNVSAIPKVREFLLDLQRNIAKTNNVIMDGRDIATVILPNADVKIFLTASAEKRAHRRYLELLEKGENITEQEVLEDVKKRDYQDSHREIAPLMPSGTSIIVDTSELTLDESINTIIKIVKEHLK